MGHLTWNIEGFQVEQFLHSKCQEFLESQPFIEREIEFKLVVYPKGFDPNHSHLKIWLNSHGEIPPLTAPHIDCELMLTITFHSDLGRKLFTWNQHIVMEHAVQSKMLSCALTDKIDIPFIRSLSIHRCTKIVFNCTLTMQQHSQSHHASHNVNVASSPATILNLLSHTAVSAHRHGNQSVSVASSPSKVTQPLLQMAPTQAPMPQSSPLRPQSQSSSASSSVSSERPLTQFSEHSANSNVRLTRQSLRTQPPLHNHSQFHSTQCGAYTFRWRISGIEMQRLLNCKVGEAIESASFLLANDTTWKLLLYPNGVRDKVGSIALFLDCTQFARLLSSFRCMIDVYCIQTDTHSSNAYMFGNTIHDNPHERRKSSVPLWLPYSVASDQLKYQSALDIEVTLRVIETSFKEYSGPRNGLGFVTEQHTFSPVSGFENVCWCLPVTQAFGNEMRKTLVSPRFDIWCLRVNGHNTPGPGFVAFELFLVTHPLGVHELEYEAILSLPQFDLTSSAINGRFRVGKCKFANFLRDTQQPILLNVDRVRKLSFLKVELQLRVLRQFDKKGKEIECPPSSTSTTAVTHTDNGDVNNDGEEKECRNEEMETRLLDLKHAVDFLKNEAEELRNENTFLRNKLSELETKQTQVEDSAAVNVLHMLQQQAQEAEAVPIDLQHLSAANPSDEEQVRAWFEQQLKLPQYCKVFVDDGWDQMETLQYVTEEHLQDMNITKPGHRNKIMRYVEVLKNKTEEHVK